MNEVFQRLDKHDEGILRRSEFVMALRTDAKVIDFIDCEAVKKAYSNNTLTLDQVLLEIEKDERYDQSQGKLGKNEINHKEFVTWREFLNYFNETRGYQQYTTTLCSYYPIRWVEHPHHPHRFPV